MQRYWTNRATALAAIFAILVAAHCAVQAQTVTSPVSGGSGGGAPATTPLGGNNSSSSVAGLVAVGGNTTAAVSKDNGLTWVGVTPASSDAWSTAAWNGTVYTAVAGTSANTKTMTSADGTNWTIHATALPQSSTYYYIAWSPTLSLYAAINSGAGATAIATSPDGVTWTPRTNGGGAALSNLIWAGTKFVATGTGGGNGVTSTDGITWASATNPNAAWQTIAWNGTNLFCVTDSTTTTMTSADGVTWIKNAAAIFNGGWNINSAAYNPASSLFVVVGSSSAATSPDCVTWTSRAIPAGNWKTLVWNGTVLATVASNTSVATSIDGITWTAHAISSNVTWGGVATSYTTSLTPSTGSISLNDNLTVGGLIQGKSYASSVGNGEVNFSAATGPTTFTSGPTTAPNLSTAGYVKNSAAGLFSSGTTERDFCVSTSGVTAVAFGQTISTNASTLTAASNVTPNGVIGVGAGNFVAKLCSDGVTCGAGNIYLTCTAACTVALGTVTACSVTKAAVPAATTLTWGVATACTSDSFNACAHFTTP